MIDDVTPKDLAARIGVHPSTVSRWCKEGRIRASRKGRTFTIPMLDAQIFADAYVTTHGEPLSPDVPVRRARYRVPNRRIQPGTKRQGMYVTIQAELLHMVDDERREEAETISRSEFVEAAIGYYVNARKRERMSARRKVAS